MRKTIFVSLILLLSVVGCGGYGDYSAVPNSVKYCKDRGGVVYVTNGGHPKSWWCSNGDHTHKK